MKPSKIDFTFNDVDDFLKNHKIGFTKHIESLGYCCLQYVIKYDSITVTFTRQSSNGVDDDWIYDCI